MADVWQSGQFKSSKSIKDKKLEDKIEKSVDNKISDLIDSAPEELNTLKELALFSQDLKTNVTDDILELKDASSIITNKILEIVDTNYVHIFNIRLVDQFPTLGYYDRRVDHLEYPPDEVYVNSIGEILGRHGLIRGSVYAYNWDAGYMRSPANTLVGTYCLGSDTIAVPSNNNIKRLKSGIYINSNISNYGKAIYIYNGGHFYNLLGEQITYQDTNKVYVGYSMLKYVNLSSLAALEARVAELESKVSLLEATTE